MVTSRGQRFKDAGERQAVDGGLPVGDQGSEGAIWGRNTSHLDQLINELEKSKDLQEFLKAIGAPDVQSQIESAAKSLETRSLPTLRWGSSGPSES